MHRDIALEIEAFARSNQIPWNTDLSRPSSEHWETPTYIDEELNKWILDSFNMDTNGPKNPPYRFPFQQCRTFTTLVRNHLIELMEKYKLTIRPIHGRTGKNE